MPKTSQHVPGPIKQNDCSFCANRQNTIWSVLVEEDVQILNNFKHCEFHPQGSYIFTQGSSCRGIYSLTSGLIGIRKMDTRGNSALVRLMHQGSTFGYRTYFSGGEYTANAEAIKDSHVCFISRKGIDILLEKYPQLSKNFLKRFANDLLEAEESLLRTSSLPVRLRLVNFLLQYKDHYGKSDANGTITFELPLSRTDIASVLCTRPETITRTLRSMEEDRIIGFSGRTVVIDDQNALLEEYENYESGYDLPRQEV